MLTQQHIDIAASNDHDGNIPRSNVAMTVLRSFRAFGGPKP